MLPSTRPPRSVLAVAREPSIRVVRVDLRRNPNREFAKNNNRMQDEA